MTTDPSELETAFCRAIGRRIITAKRQKRGAVQKSGATFIAAWIPDETVAALDRAVLREDTDRSKLMRKALHAYLGKTA